MMNAEIYNVGQYRCEWCAELVRYEGTDTHLEHCRSAIVAWLLAEHLFPAHSESLSGREPQ